MMACNFREAVQRPMLSGLGYQWECFDARETLFIAKMCKTLDLKAIATCELSMNFAILKGSWNSLNPACQRPEQRHFRHTHEYFSYNRSLLTGGSIKVFNAICLDIHRVCHVYYSSRQKTEKKKLLLKHSVECAELCKQMSEQIRLKSSPSLT